MKNRYIDANILRPLFQDWFESFDWYDGETEKHTIATAIRTLDAMPTADVRRVTHGEWVLSHPSQLWECTNCHEREIRTTDFCPWCGAEMRKREKQ